MVKRDFTIASYESFCAMIRQIQDEQWSGITDWFGDAYLTVKHWLGDLGLYDKMADLDKYHKEVLDKEDTSIAKLEQIFEEVSSVDTMYTGSSGPDFGFVYDVMGNYSQMVMKLASIAVSVDESIKNGGKLEDCFRPDIIAQLMANISTDLGIALNEIRFTADTFGSLPDDYKQEYVDRIELEHPEYKELMARALSDPDLTDDERRDIKFLIYNGPEPYRSIYIEHMRDYKIQVRKTYIDETDGKEKKQGCFYKPAEGRIYLGDYDSTFALNPRGPYNTFFHESGHLIDDYEYRSWSGNGDSLSTHFEYNGQSLNDWIAADTRDYVNKYIDTEMSELSAEQREQLLRSLNLTDDAGFGYRGDDSALDKKLKGYRDRIVRYMDTDLEGEVNEAASDVYGGVTNNALVGSYGHWRDDYWYDSQGRRTNYQSLELWAEFYAAQMTHDEESLMSIRRHFPNAYQAMEEMAKEMAKGKINCLPGRGSGGGGGRSF